MKKRILILGGSLFVGRVFTILASRTEEYELHVVNRGHYPLNLEGVAEYKCDRHSPRRMTRLLPEDIVFDAAIDFCAYDAGDIEPILSALGDRIRHYIYFSTASVYDPSRRKIKTEGDPLMPVAPHFPERIVPSFPEPSSSDEAYIRGKILLERELAATAGALGIPYTILRPSFIYGPLNYAPRESYFVEMIARRHVVPVPTDATASFNFVYVKDVAAALMTIIGAARAANEVFNLAAPERVTYMRLIGDFERFNGGSFETREVTVEEAEREHLPLPFPLTEDDLTSGERFAKTFSFRYTPFLDGMEATFKAFYSLFVS
ncbi:MAG: NAD-dependent epimerase/dehydratase family protein [Oscillospiraceae bacterium]|jgi:nucleoside-diphosphate-sugar epimerase|nr:NAD-dependent epimerase/dehydratase family protein [Oscillospiraceae bacterium]